MTTTPNPKKRTTPTKKALPAGGPVLDGPPPAPAPTFQTSQAQGGIQQCRVCLLHLPVRAFPTVSGPEHRSTRCRACRDAISPTV